MNQETASTLVTVVETIERVCRAHVAIADFDYGDLQVFNNQVYNYPMCYLETIADLQEGALGASHTYTVTLNVVDRRAAAAPKDTQPLVHLQDKLSQLFFEIKNALQLDFFFGKERVSPADILIFPDFADVRTLRLRAEFQVTIDTIDNDYPDLEILFPTLF